MIKEMNKDDSTQEIGYRENMAKDQSKVEKSANYFKNGFNCSQVVQEKERCVVLYPEH